MKKRRDLALLLRYLTGTFMFILVCTAIAQVVARFILNDSLVWSEELARFILVWMVFIGAAVVSYDDTHMAVELFEGKMSPKMKLIKSLIMRIIILFFITITIFSSFELIQASHYYTSGALEIRFSYWRVSVTIGFILMFIFIIIRTIYDISDYRKGVLGKTTKK